MKAAVLVIEDDEATRELICGLLEGRGYRCVTTGDARSARELLLSEDFELLLCDIALRGESGLQLARHVTAEHHDTAVLMVSSQDDPETAASALALGACGYLIKPFRPQQLLIAVAAALRRRSEELAGRRDRETLEREAAALRGAVSQFEQSTRSAALPDEEAVGQLTRAISARSFETGDHLARVGRISRVLAERVGLPRDRCEVVEEASALHDIGKVAVADRILLKPGPLTAAERAEVERHAEVGHYVLSGSGSEVMQVAADIALTHHEHFDGGGYPNGLSGEAIPLEGRIVAVADVFDALTSERVYRPAYSVEEAVALMREERGRQFDPAVLDSLLADVSALERTGAESAQPGAARPAA